MRFPPTSPRRVFGREASTPLGGIARGLALGLAVGGIGLSLLLAILLSLPALLSSLDEAPLRADVIYVFPGQVPDRALCGAELWRRGVGDRILLSGESVKPELIAAGVPLTDAEVNARILQAAGVPESDVVVISRGTSTWEDVAVLRDWLRQHPPADEVIAVTSPLHSRRAGGLLREALGGDATRVSVVSCQAPPGLASRWFLDEKRLIQVVDESLKSALYILAYRLPWKLGFGAAPALPPDRQ